MDSNDSQSVVFITGASNGLGRALAVVYAKAGHNLLLTGRDASALQETVAIAEGAGVTVFSIVQDFAASDAIDKIMAFIESNHLTVAVLINNAGLGSHSNFAHLAEEDARMLLAVNIQSLVMLTNKIVPLMVLKKQGCIVNIASVYAYASIPGQVLYSASKAFVKSFSLGLSLDLKRYGIRVCCMCPGSTTQTKFRKRIGLQVETKRFSASAEVIADKIYIALKKSPRVYVPLWYNKLFVFLMQCIPTALMANVGAFVVYRLRKIKEISRE
ncbi:MAG: SDR family NAD(P)-dependent oxidoreductase [Legionellaceae bacterium]|nr:SDR family NAD(P)-dependent oxidoreductase [Legionellaceae bacterium]MBP9776043.1 SDR family NAD(P)-dependent oxidoreductase [Legionellaceae bacterium]